MKPLATVRTADLEEALDYLEGLHLILATLDQHGIRNDMEERLAESLGTMDSHGMNWEPLRYQPVDRQGWGYVAANVANLRDRLLEGYADAAL